jgi:hypothetical protein
MKGNLILLRVCEHFFVLKYTIAEPEALLLM